MKTTDILIMAASAAAVFFLLSGKSMKQVFAAGGEQPGNSQNANTLPKYLVDQASVITKPPGYFDDVCGIFGACGELSF